MLRYRVCIHNDSVRDIGPSPKAFGGRDLWTADRVGWRRPGHSWPDGWPSPWSGRGCRPGHETTPPASRPGQGGPSGRAEGSQARRRGLEAGGAPARSPTADRPRPSAEVQAEKAGRRGGQGQGPRSRARPRISRKGIRKTVEKRRRNDDPTRPGDGHTPRHSPPVRSSLGPCRPALIIRQTPEVHDEIGRPFGAAPAGKIGPRVRESKGEFHAERRRERRRREDQET